MSDQIQREPHFKVDTWINIEGPVILLTRSEGTDPPTRMIERHRLTLASRARFSCLLRNMQVIVSPFLRVDFFGAASNGDIES